MATWQRVLQIVCGVGLVVTALAAGFLHRSPWLIPALGLVFTGAYIQGKRSLWRTMPRARLLPALATTYAVQCVVVGVFFVLGYGLGALIYTAAGPQPVGPSDGGWLLLAVFFKAIATLTDERPAPPAPPAAAQEPAAEIEIESRTVTPASFYSAIHYSHGDTPNEKSAGDEAKIATAEQRLGVRLPDGLRQLYLLQNGGHLHPLCVPKPDVTSVRLYDHVVHPFTGYDDLSPIEMLRTVYDSVTDYADPETDADQFPAGSRQMIVLAQWYQHTLFLDYREPGGEPRVGFVDFDHGDWQAHCTWWPNFAAFFASLRHYHAL